MPWVDSTSDPDLLCLRPAILICGRLNPNSRPAPIQSSKSGAQTRGIDTLATLVTILGFMRFPLPLTAKIAAYMIGHKLRGTKKFATVLQLEPLHTCNLTCTGCGRIREYSTSLKDMMTLEDCLGAAQECDAPMASSAGANR